MRMLCPECGKRAVEPRAMAGRYLPYRNFPALPVPADLVLPTCTNCGSERIGAREAERLDAALERASAEALSGLAREAIEAIQETVTQRDLEARLGLSPGYVSKVKRGRETPSPALVAALVLLAVRPNRIRALQNVWTTLQLPPRLATDNVATWRGESGLEGEVAS